MAVSRTPPLVRLIAPAGGARSCLPSIKTPASHKPGEDAGKYLANIAAAITRDHPILRQAVEHVHRGNGAVGESRNNGLSSRGIEVGGSKTQRPVVVAYAPGPAKCRILTTQLSPAKYGKIRTGPAP